MLQTTSDVLPLSYKAVQTSWGSKHVHAVCSLLMRRSRNSWHYFKIFPQKSRRCLSEPPPCEATLKSFLLFSPARVWAGRLVTPLTSEYCYLFDQSQRNTPPTYQTNTARCGCIPYSVSPQCQNKSSTTTGESS